MKDGVYIVGYGTLLDRASLGLTIGDASSENKAMLPVRVKGFRRLYNLRPDHYEPSYFTVEEALEVGAANVEPAPNGQLNGLAFQVHPNEIAALDQRERYYLRKEVPVESFTTGELLGRGFIYASALDARWIERDVAKLLPKWRDIVLARRGSYAVSEAFGRLFDVTTFMADGRTPVVDFYRDWLDPMMQDDPVDG